MKFYALATMAISASALRLQIDSDAFDRQNIEKLTNSLMQIKLADPDHVEDGGKQNQFLNRLVEMSSDIGDKLKEVRARSKQRRSGRRTLRGRA